MNSSRSSLMGARRRARLQTVTVATLMWWTMLKNQIQIFHTLRDILFHNDTANKILPLVIPNLPSDLSPSGRLSRECHSSPNVLPLICYCDVNSPVMNVLASPHPPGWASGIRVTPQGEIRSPPDIWWHLDCDSSWRISRPTFDLFAISQLHLLWNVSVASRWNGKWLY